MGSDRRANTSRNSRDELLIEWTGSYFCNPGSPTDDNDDESNRHRHRASPLYAPPPDAEGNPPCEFGVSWETFYPPVPVDEPPGEAPHGTLVDVEKRPIVPNRFVDLPDHFAVVVRTKDGRHITEDDYVSRAATGDWDSVVEKSFIFRTVDPLDVKEVLLTSSKATCWVQGNP